jgi:ABC-type multidrug transport system fused ATPase/permease subunit
MTQTPKHRGSVPRLIAIFRPEGARLAAVTVLNVISIGFSIAAPLLLGAATNILFAGLIGKELPRGATHAQALAYLRAHGQGEMTGMVSAMNVTPGAGVDLTRLGQLLIWAAVLYLISSVFSWIQGYLMAGVGQRVAYRLRRSVEGKLGRLPLQYFDSHPHGDILSRVTNDIDNISTTLEQVMSQLPNAVLTIVGVLAVMFWISPLLGGVSLATIPLMVIAMMLLAARSKVAFTAQWDQTGRLNGMAEETYTGHSLVLTFGRRAAMAAGFARRNDKLYAASFAAQFLSGLVSPLILLFGNLNYAVIAVVGGVQVATGAISLGAIQAFIQYSARFSLPIAQIANRANLIQSGLASLDRVFELLDADEEPVIAADTRDGAAAGPALELALAGHALAGRRVQLQQVSFRYDPDRPLIEDFTLEAAPGQTVAIVGPTGAGKTTLVNLLMRFYEIDSGQILLDGVDYRDLTRDEVRRCISMVLQDTWLFAGTIWDNIAYGKDGATDEEVIAAARAAHADEFIRALPDGYATVLDPDASSVSTGQRQLLTIARAFLASPGILILDEATSSVDTRTEVMIQDAMTRLRQGQTSFIIAHRLSTIRDADTIVVMDGGRIVQQGSHEELVSRTGVYQDLYNSQFAGATTS